MGGGLVVRTAAAVPDRVGAGASFHGGGLVTDRPNSPHLLAPKVKAPDVLRDRDQRRHAAARCEDEAEGSLRRGEGAGRGRGLLDGAARMVRARYARRRPTVSRSTKWTTPNALGQARWRCTKPRSSDASQFPTPNAQLPGNQVIGSWELEVGRCLYFRVSETIRPPLIVTTTFSKSLMSVSGLPSINTMSASLPDSSVPI